MLSPVLRTKRAAAQNYDHRVLTLQFGKLAMFSGVIGKLVIREDRPWNNVGAHFIKKKSATIPNRSIQDVHQDDAQEASGICDLNPEWGDR